LVLFFNSNQNISKHLRVTFIAFYYIIPWSDVDGRIILRGIFRKWEGVVGTGWSGLRIRTGGGRL
jgi:hypothetical protein